MHAGAEPGAPVRSDATEQAAEAPRVALVMVVACMATGDRGHRHGRRSTGAREFERRHLAAALRRRHGAAGRVASAPLKWNVLDAHREFSPKGARMTAIRSLTPKRLLGVQP